MQRTFLGHTFECDCRICNHYETVALQVMDVHNFEVVGFDYKSNSGNYSGAQWERKQQELCGDIFRDPDDGVVCICEKEKGHDDSHEGPIYGRG